MAEMKVGKKIDPEKAKTMDRSKMGVGLIQPPQGDVEGQRVGAWVQCPCWGHANYIDMHETVYEWWTCGACGCAFQA